MRTLTELEEKKYEDLITQYDERKGRYLFLHFLSEHPEMPLGKPLGVPAGKRLGGKWEAEQERLRYKKGLKQRREKEKRPYYERKEHKKEYPEEEWLRWHGLRKRII